MSYVRRSLGLTQPEGPNIFEVFLRVRSRPGVLGRLATLLGSLNINILDVHGQELEPGEGTIIMYVDLGKASMSLEGVLDRLRRDPDVTEVRAEPNEPTFFEHFYFPLTSGGRFPVFAISVDSWLTLEEELYRRFGTPAMVLLQEIGRTIGRAAVKKIGERPMSTAQTPTILERNFVEMFRAFGLGLLQVEAKNGSYQVVIREPLMSHRETEVLDHFSVGMVAGALEQIHGGRLAVKDLSYEREGRAIRFTLTRVE